MTEISSKHFHKTLLIGKISPSLVFPSTPLICYPSRCLRFKIFLYTTAWKSQLSSISVNIQSAIMDNNLYGFISLVVSIHGTLCIQTGRSSEPADGGEHSSVRQRKCLHPNSTPHKIPLHRASRVGLNRASIVRSPVPIYQHGISRISTI